MFHSNCIYDLNTEDGDDLLVYGERVKLVACFNAKGTTRLDVKEDRKWRLAARSSRMTIDVRRCGRKFRYRHAYSWQVDVLPADSEKLQMRLVSGNWKRMWVSPVAESQQEVLDGASWLATCVERSITGLPCN